MGVNHAQWGTLTGCPPQSHFSKFQALAMHVPPDFKIYVVKRLEVVH
jgi:hypothetical protein